jgi:hypothetical protein
MGGWIVVEITYEEIKDLRIMLSYMIRDYKQLAKDMETLSDSLRPVMVKLQIEEESNVEHE